MRLVPAEGAILDEILDATFDIWNEGLNRDAYAKYYRAQLATEWGRDHLRRWALVDRRGELLASAKTYRFDARLDTRSIRVIGLGAIFTQPPHRGRGHARTLVERLLAQASAEGADLALLFSEIGPDYYARLGFVPIPTTELALQVVESDRHGAPATLVRSGEARDLGDMADMGSVRATSFSFHLARNRDLIRYGIGKKRLLAGLGPRGEREVQFFVAEEGASAVAYVVISVTRHGAAWTIEEVGDRDPSGARIGAILQVLIAREPAEARPAIRGWLPGGFCPPQLRILERRPSNEMMMVRPLTSRGTPMSPLDEMGVLYWPGDRF